MRMPVSGEAGEREAEVASAPAGAGRKSNPCRHQRKPNPRYARQGRPAWRHDRPDQPKGQDSPVQAVLPRKRVYRWYAGSVEGKRVTGWYRSEMDAARVLCRCNPGIKSVQGGVSGNIIRWETTDRHATPPKGAGQAAAKQGATPDHA